jgi:uncharacterized protein
MRVVLDTNVWLSAMLWGGVPGQILQRVESGELQAIGSEPILDELRRTLDRPKLKKRLTQLRLEADAVLRAIRQIMIVVPTALIEVPNLRDPKDAIIVAAAISGNVEAIITGDQDLLVLVAVEAIPILLPRDFLSNWFPF